MTASPDNGGVATALFTRRRQRTDLAQYGLRRRSVLLVGADVPIPDHAVAVDDERRDAGDVRCLVEYVVRRHGVRPGVAQDRERQRLLVDGGLSLLAGVDADCDESGPDFAEAGVGGLQLAELLATVGSPLTSIEDDGHRFPGVIRQRDCLAPPVG